MRRIKEKKVIYILLINLKEPKKIKVGKLGMMIFKPGIYLYLGSAQAGFKTRIRRHLRNEKKLFWHIDYLLREAEIEEVWLKKDESVECKTAMEIQNYSDFSFHPIKGFGSSDCNCLTHLFYFPECSSKIKDLRTKLKFEKLETNGN
ncbi:MAG: DUF123 domain-containing protein [Candidatus Aminicenantia bacterium]